MLWYIRSSQIHQVFQLSPHSNGSLQLCTSVRSRLQKQVSESPFQCHSSTAREGEKIICSNCTFALRKKKLCRASVKTILEGVIQYQISREYGCIHINWLKNIIFSLMKVSCFQRKKYNNTTFPHLENKLKKRYVFISSINCEWRYNIMRNCIYFFFPVSEQTVKAMTYLSKSKQQTLFLSIKTSPSVVGRLTFSSTFPKRIVPAFTL